MKNKHRVWPLVLWLAGMLACLLVIVQTRFVADLSAFMPRTPNVRQQLLIDQLRDGAVARRPQARVPQYVPKGRSNPECRHRGRRQ